MNTGHGQLQFPCTGVNFDSIVFRPMTLAAWKQRYGTATRISRDFKRIRKAKVGIKLADRETEMYLVHYTKGDWRDGEPKRAQIGSRLMLCRLPAVKVGNKFLVIDGMHRLGERPAMVILDYLILPRSERVYITDLFNKFWQEQTKSTEGFRVTVFTKKARIRREQKKQANK